MNYSFIFLLQNIFEFTIVYLFLFTLFFSQIKTTLATLLKPLILTFSIKS